MGVVVDKLLGKPLLHTHRFAPLILTDYGSLPDAGSSYRGNIVFTHGSDRALWNNTVENWDGDNNFWDDTTDPGDKLYLCYRKSDASYEWLDLTTALSVGLWDQT